jgi:RNA polymerase sigma factor (TIGR02999 family)
MTEISPQQITALLVRWSKGDDSALEQLTPLVYGDLRKLAGWLMRDERPGHTLQPTALVNEAYLRLAGDKKVTWQNRAHFLAVAAHVMRHILVDYARHRNRLKRGGGIEILPLEDALVFAPEASRSLLELNDALQHLSEKDPRKARVVELRYFGGLTVDEAAEVLQISPNTVMRDWEFSKAWLRTEIEERNNDSGGEMEAG